jgi:hypothetical protein
VGGEIETVELLKPEMGGLGLLICEHDHLPGVYVKEVVQHKAAYLDKRVMAGDKLLAINGQDTSIATQDHVVKLLQVGVCEKGLQWLPSDVVGACKPSGVLAWCGGLGIVADTAVLELAC